MNLPTRIASRIVNVLGKTSNSQHRDRLFRWMAGCIKIGQSGINVKSGGRGHLSSLVASVFLLLRMVFIGDWFARIPMAALVSVMIMVSIGTFSLISITNIRTLAVSSNIVMITTVVVVVATHDLAKGVSAGVQLSGFFFAHKIAQFCIFTHLLKQMTMSVPTSLLGKYFLLLPNDLVMHSNTKKLSKK